MQRRQFLLLPLAVLPVVLTGNAEAGRSAPPLEAYGKLPGCELAALSPSGKRSALLGVVGERRQLVVVENGGAMILTIDVSDKKVRDIGWAGEDLLLVTITETYGLGIGFTVSRFEAAQVLVVNLVTRKISALLAKPPSFGGVYGSYGVTQEEGRWYGYFGGITMASSKGGEQYYWQDGHPDLYRIDLATGKARIAARGGEGDTARRWALGFDGKVKAWFDFNGQSGRWSLRAPGRPDAIASGLDPLGNVLLLGLGRTPHSVLYRRTDKDGDEHWLEVDLATGQETTLLDDVEVSARLIDTASGQLIGYTVSSDRPEQHFFDATREARMQATRKAFPGLVVRLESWNDAFDRLIVTTEGEGDSGTWWLVDIKTGKADDIAYSYVGVPANQVGSARMFSYKAADGLAISGVLTLPPGKHGGALPLVVLPHGGPHHHDRLGFDWWAQAFASRGYAVFQPNFRGSTGYGSRFRDAGKGQWGGKMQTDISDGVDELARQGIVDPKRACIMGASYGGYAALAGVTVEKGRYRCAVSVAGVSDLTALFQYDMRASGGQNVDRRSWQDYIGKGRMLREISPAELASRADAPILLIHGKDDTVVPFEQSKIMQRALNEAGKPVELVVLPDEDHWLSRSATRLTMLQAAMAFIQKHNPA